MAKTVQELNDAMENDEEFRRILDAHSDKDGTIIPTERAIDAVEKENANRPDAEKWRLAQARTILDLHERMLEKRRTVSN